MTVSGSYSTAAMVSDLFVAPDVLETLFIPVFIEPVYGTRSSLLRGGPNFVEVYFMTELTTALGNQPGQIEVLSPLQLGIGRPDRSRKALALAVKKSSYY